MGNAISLKQYSKGILLNEGKEGTAIVLSQQTTNVVAILTIHNTGGHSFGQTTEFKLKLELDYGSHALPVIGFFNKQPDLESLWLEDEDHPDFSFWYVTTGRLVVEGREYPLKLPRCEPGCKIDIDVVSTSVQLTVANPQAMPKEVSFNLPEISINSKPFLGAVRTGRRKVVFQLLNTMDPDNGFNSSSFSNVTSTTTFSYSDGVINVSSDGKSLTRTSTQQGNGYALLNQKIRNGIHRLTLKVTVDFGASLCVGVARYPFKLSAEYIKDPMKHIYRHPGLLLWRSYRGLLYVDGKQQDRSTEALGWQHGNVILIELIINMEDQTIELLKNDISLGIIFTDIPEVVQPVVCYYAAYEKAIQLVSYKVSESAVATPVPKPRTASIRSQKSFSIPSEAVFDPSTKLGLMTLSSDKKTVSREKNQAGNSLCLFNVTCDRNCFYRFSLIVENDQGASVCVGVTNVMNTKDIRINGIGNIYSSPHLYVFRSFQGMLYEKGRELPKHLEEYWMTGTLLEMMIDVGEREATVQYAINGNDQGIAFSGIRPPVRPLVAFYAGMEKRVTLIHFEAKSTAPQVVPEVMPNRFTQLQSLQSLKRPIITRMKSFTECEFSNCKKRVDCIALPCEHTRLCAEHLSALGCSCGTVDKRELRMWNYF